MVNVPDHRPGCHLVSGCPYHRYVVTDLTPAHIAGVGCLTVICIVGFDDVVFTVKLLITNELYFYRSVLELFNSEHCHILALLLAKGNTHHNGVHVVFHIVIDHDVVNQIVTVEVKVINF